MPESPYSNLPETAFWRDSVSLRPGFMLDPSMPVPIRIERDTKVATGGSCFAQHIARRLKASGYHYYVTEPAPDTMTEAEADRHNYGVYSARYGNVYTTRQLVQLFDRAYGRFDPVVKVWRGARGGYVDPYRPRIQPEDYASEAEVIAAAEAHLARVREMFETLDIFVFTLGLTETWRVKADGAVLPLAPGAGGGDWDPDAYEFVNLTVDEVATDLTGFITRLQGVNPGAQVILTVSPVPLVATYSGRHVVQATAYSKAVLRVAAEQAVAENAQTLYFPSYEIVTSPAVAHRYFEADLRSVNASGVDHVMRMFFRRFMPDGEPMEAEPRFAWTPAQEIADGQKLVCEEDLLDRLRDAAQAAAPVDQPENADVQRPGLIRRALRKGLRVAGLRDSPADAD